MIVVVTTDELDRLTATIGPGVYVTVPELETVVEEAEETEEAGTT